MSDDGDLDALLARGFAQQRIGQYRAALQIYGVVQRRGGGGAALCCRLGECHAAIGDLDRADDCFAEAIRLDPDHDRAYREAAELARRASELAERAGQGEAAAQLREGAYGYLAALGVRLVRRSAWREAEAAFRQARALGPTEWAVHVDLGHCLVELGRLADGEAAIRHGLGLGPDRALAHYFLGIALRRQGRAGEAEAALRRAVELDPGLAAAAAELASLLAERDGPAPA